MLGVEFFMIVLNKKILNICFLFFGLSSSIIHGENLSNHSIKKSEALFLKSAVLVSEGSENSTLVTLDSTILPIVLIDTDGKTIPNENKITARMKIINNDNGEFNKPTDIDAEYEGYIGIEIRGHSSASYPQKPYGLETRDSLGNNLNVSLMGMPKENDWILLSNYNDKSLVRNILSFELFRRMGHYAVRARLCEVLLNSEYQGIYVFCEKIKQDKNRVDIAALTPDDTTGNQMTGGYIFKVDYHDPSNSWRSDFPAFDYPEKKVYYVYVEPKAAEITLKQKTYIQDFIRNAESALYENNFADPAIGYRGFIDVSSFIDYFILSEVSRNVDGYKKSRFFFKDRYDKDSLLYAGPPWDFDWAWKNIRECIYNNTNGANWSYKTNDCNPDNNAPDWYIRLLQDGYFTNRLIDRYEALRKDFLNLETINYFIDSIATLVDQANKRHFDRWPINSRNAAPEVEPPSETYNEEISRLKEWIRKRLTWLDINIPRLRNNITSAEGASSKPSVFLLLQNYPNPFNSSTKISFTIPERSFVTLKIFDALGREVSQLVSDEISSGTYSYDWDAEGLPSGIYFYQLMAKTISSGFYSETKKLVLLK